MAGVVRVATAGSGGGGGYEYNVLAISAKQVDEGLSVSWTDPEDGDWIGTKLVRKNKDFRNLLANDGLATYTQNGVTFAKNSDGSLRVNGTVPSGLSTYMLTLDADPLVLEPGQQYVVSGNSANAAVKIAIYSGGTWIRNIGYTNGLPAFVAPELEAGQVIKGFVQVSTPNVTLTNEIVKPQLELGATATAYMPYVGPEDPERWPQSLSDGKQVVDSKVKNQYATEGFVDTNNLDFDQTYYYRAFPYSKKGSNFSYLNRANPVTYSEIPLVTTVPMLGIVQQGVGAELFFELDEDDITRTALSIPEFAGKNFSTATFSDDGRYLACGGSPSRIYSVDGTTFTEIPTDIEVSILRVFSGIAFSPDNRYVAITLTTESPYLVVLKNNGTIFTKLPNPSVLPSGAAYGCSFSADGKLLTVAHDSSPYMTTYLVGDDTFTKVANPTLLPNGTTGSRDCKWHPIEPLLVITSIGSTSGGNYVGQFSWDGAALTRMSSVGIAAAGSGTIAYIAMKDDGSAFIVKGSQVQQGGSTYGRYLCLFKFNGSVYVRTGDVVTPSVVGYAMGFNKTGTRLYVSQMSAPFIAVYTVSGDTYTLSDTSGLGATVACQGLPAIIHNK